MAALFRQNFFIILIIIMNLSVMLKAAFIIETNQLMNTNDINSDQNLNASYSDPNFNASFAMKEKRNPTNKLICFYVFTKKFSPDIMNTLCTHINVGFFDISHENNSLIVSNEQEKVLSQIVLLKNNDKHLKVIISVGGAGDKGFSSMVSNHTTRKMFVRSCMNILKKFKIDGVDLDWEYPVLINGNTKEKIKFVQLLQEFREEFERHEKNYILSVDVPSVKVVIELGYYVNYIAKYVNYVNVMCYDYHYFTKLYPFTGHNAPLYSVPNELINKNVNSSIYLWISETMPREKIILGIPTYGHTFTLTHSDQHSVSAPAKGYGAVGQFGFADYQQICEFLKNNSTTVDYDKVSKVPYAYRYPEWISFDNEGSVAIKASYILKEKLGGAMVFSVNADDYNGSCLGNGLPLPLIRKIRNILFNKV